jgi:glyoxylase-like metal-dependent hydrolase (beta-lactamase superfamily II)
MTIKPFTFNPFQTNCFVCSSGDSAVIVDPSSSVDSEHDRVIDYIRERGLDVERILLTHAHIDHIFGLASLCEAFTCSYWMHRADLPFLRHADEQAALFGTTIDSPPEPGGFLDEGDLVEVGDHEWQVLHTPGHSPGSISFFDPAEGAVLSGDVLFAGSIGRTDLWQGSLPLLMQSIFQKLVPLGESVRVLPGHGLPTTLAEEVAHNPFLTGQVAGGFS